MLRGSLSVEASGQALRADPDAQVMTLPLLSRQVSGPPCPPWSNVGLKKGRGDPRSDIYYAVLTMAIKLIKDILGFFSVSLGIQTLDFLFLLPPPSAACSPRGGGGDRAS